VRTDELQMRLRSLGFDPGPTDGIYGEMTEEAVFDALDKYAPAVELPSGIIPMEWLPVCQMERVICHWTAGAYKASVDDVHAYHILIEDTGNLVRGSYSIKDNVDTSDGRYAAHTKNCNSGSIGVSLCCMAGAVESPFNPGKYPMTQKQFDMLAQVVAELCDTYDIPVEPETVLTHAEVQGTLGITQSGKWDYTRLAFAPEINGAKACGDMLRSAVTESWASLMTAPPAVAVSPSPDVAIL